MKRIKARLDRDWMTGEPEWVFPADAESYAKLTQQVDEAIERGINRWLAGTSGPDGCRRLPHEVLRAIGITQPRKVKGSK